MLAERKEGWFVVNVKDCEWFENKAFGKVASFDRVQGPLEEIGLRVYLLEPGKSNCRYHRESAQENFLVLAGECLLLVNGEERPLATWDFVHCPPGVSHVFIGAGNGPCAILMLGRRPVEQLYYPSSELARRHGAESPVPTPDPQVAYADVPAWEPTETPTWPPA